MCIILPFPGRVSYSLVIIFFVLFSKRRQIYSSVCGLFSDTGRKINLEFIINKLLHWCSSLIRGIQTKCTAWHIDAHDLEIWCMNNCRARTSHQSIIFPCHQQMLNFAIICFTYHLYSRNILVNFVPSYLIHEVNHCKLRIFLMFKLKKMLHVMVNFRPKQSSVMLLSKLFVYFKFIWESRWGKKSHTSITAKAFFTKSIIENRGYMALILNLLFKVVRQLCNLMETVILNLNK